MTLPSDQQYWNQQSWVESANDPAVGFSLQSLPLCSFVPPDSADGASHLGVGIGEFVLDLHALSTRGYFSRLGPDVEAALLAPQLNALMRCGYGAWGTARLALSMHLLETRDSRERSELEPHLVPQRDVRFCKPVAVGNYTDFYLSGGASVESTTGSSISLSNGQYNRIYGSGTDTLTIDSGATLQGSGQVGFGPGGNGGQGWCGST